MKSPFAESEKPGRVGECLLGSQLDIGMRQSWDIVELPGDLCCQGKELDCLQFHAGKPIQ